MADSLVIRIDDGPIARLTLNDPKRANVLSSAMIETLFTAVSEAGVDNSIRVIVVGANGRVFCAGHDLAELRAGNDQSVHERLFRRCSELMLAIAMCPKPVIARVTGAAVAAGCQLVASCDLAYAERGARFAVSGINLGLFCSTPGVALSRKVGRGVALEMLLTGRFVGAEEAASIGLINRVADVDSLDAMIDEAAMTIAAKPAEAAALGKAFFQRQVELPLAEAYELAALRMAQNLAFPSARGGIDAFLSHGPVSSKVRS
ncbi:MAG TPA: enoyl-CoA hydratase [Caulobacteraceae bacterium]